VSTKTRTRRKRHSYSPEVADLIYERLAADGESLRQICQDTSMPARSTVFVWLRQRADFRQEYAFAKRFQIQWLADEMVE
jgi:transposase-like protein